MPPTTPTTVTGANSPKHATADSSASSETESDPDSISNSPADVHQRLARKRLLSRDRARTYRRKKSKAHTLKEKLSKEEKKIKNRDAQRKHRQREAKWATFPPAFRSIFESFPAAKKKLTKAHYVERNGHSAQFSWTTGTPKMIPIGECLAGQAPTSDFFWDKLLDKIDAKQQVPVVTNMDDGTQTIKMFEWSKVISTLLKEIGRSAESKSEFSSIFGLPLTTGDVELALPERFGRTICMPELAKEHTANIGFANQAVNFHIDTGYAALSALAGGCEKIWLLAPPREANLELLAGEDQTLPELVANLSKLEVCRQTSAEVMFLPPGVIHATFTVKTGILYGNNFRTRQNIFGATMGLVYVMREPDKEDAWIERDRIIKSWIEVMREIAEYGNEKERDEALFSFRSEAMRELRRDGAFQNWHGEIEQLAKECYPKARLRERKNDGS